MAATRLLPVLFYVLASAGSLPALAQSAVDSAARSPLAAFDARRLQLNRRGMAVLGGWGAATVIGSGIAASQTSGSARYFHQMNVGWGAINLALAGVSYLAARPAKPNSSSRATSVRAQLRTENLYLFNAGLDVAYLATGLYLLEKGRNPTASGPAERWHGYGQSLLLQGSFLLLFDGIQFATHHRHGNQALYPLLSHVSIGPGAVAVMLPLGSPLRRLIPPISFQ